MLQLLWPQLRAWVGAGDPFALATVASVSGSGPRAPGACMAVRADGRFLGSASSGCLDIGVIDAARDVLRSGGVRTLRFGPEADTPWSDGLSCGGRVEVRVERWWGADPRPGIRAVGEAVRDWLETDSAGVVVSEGEAHRAFDASGAGVAGEGEVAPRHCEEARAWLAGGRPPATLGEGAECFVRPLHRRPHLALVGAVDVAVHLSAMAAGCGWRVTVIDPRAAFASPDRFPAPVAAVLHAWPHEVAPALGLGPRDAAIVLTHDPKIDDRALLALLGTGAGYLGALGSARSHAARLGRLAALGADSVLTERIHGPAGLHLGAGDAAGIAVGMMAGVVRWAAARDRAWSAPVDRR